MYKTLLLCSIAGLAAVATVTLRPAKAQAVEAQPRAVAAKGERQIVAQLFAYRLKDPNSNGIAFLAPGQEPPASIAWNKRPHQFVTVPDASMLLTDANKVGVVSIDEVESKGGFVPLCWSEQTRIALGNWIWTPLASDANRSMFPVTIMSQIGVAKAKMAPNQAATVRIGQPVGYMLGDGGGNFKYMEDGNNFEGITTTLRVSPSKSGKADDFTIDELTMNTSWVAQRQPVPGITLDVGAPVRMDTASTSHSGIEVTGCNRAFLFVPKARANNDRLIFVLTLHSEEVGAKR